MQALVGLETVATVPVTAGVDEALGTLDVLLYERLVTIEQAHTYYSQDEVDLGTEDTRLFEEALVGGNGLVLWGVSTESSRYYQAI